MRHVDDTLALVDLCGRASARELGLWVCDCARRGVHERLVSHVEPDGAAIEHDPRFRAVLREIVEQLMGRPADLDAAARMLAALEHRHASSRLREAVDLTAAALECVSTPDSLATATEVAQLALQAMLPDQGDSSAVREFEGRWQARRLLWRTGLMPRLPDMLVRLDLAEAAGAVPHTGPAAARFDALRARIHADEDARLDLILEFGEAMYLHELGLA